MKRNLFSVFELLQASFNLYRSHGAFYAGYAAWLLLPFGGIILLSLISLPEAIAATSAILLSFAEFLLCLWIGILIIRATGKLLIYEQVDPLVIQKDAHKLMKPVIVVVVLQTLIVFGGLLLFIIPGILFMVWFIFAQMAVILNRRRGLNALSYSRFLVRGRFFTALWKNLAGPFLVVFAYAFILGTLLAIVTALTGQDPTLLTKEVPIWFEILDGIAQIFLLPFYLIYLTLVYRDFQATTAKHPED